MIVPRYTLRLCCAMAVAASSQLLPGQVAPAAGQSTAALHAALEGRVILTAPGGDTIAILVDRAAPEFLDSDGEWTRVRLEGWMHVPAEGAGAIAAPQGLRLSQVRAEPGRYRGQRVRCRVQFLGLERADELRPDIPPGRTFALFRDPGGEPGFVYALVPPDLAERVTMISPLDRVELVGEIVTGRSELTGHPILEIVEITP